MASFSPEFRHMRRHARAWKVLAALDSEFLASARCFFGGGTRIVLELDEYRYSSDIDFLCADTDGYRALRSTISNVSLGEILRDPLPLAREVRADRYGIRTVLAIDDEPVKFEIISEGRVSISPDDSSSWPVQPLDDRSCFAQKFLANADRWADKAVLSRDAIDLAFMVAGWGGEAARAGLRQAAECYGEVVTESVFKALEQLRDARYFRHCVTELAIADSGTLRKGMRGLARLLGDPG